MPYNNAAAVNSVKIGNQTKTIKTQLTPYDKTITYETGWFQPTLMQATEIVEPKETHIPTTVGRYNPSRDTGVGNAVWLVSVLNSSYQPPKTDKDLILEGLPLFWLCGYYRIVGVSPTIVFIKL